MAIQEGSKVSIHYTLTVEGEVVDTSKGNPPLEYVHGKGEIIPGLEEALIGLKSGDTKNAVVTPEKGYGPRFDQAVQKVPAASFPQKNSLKVGDMVSGQVSGKPFQGKVVEVTAADVTLDMNHPLAGKELHFEVEVVAVE